MSTKTKVITSKSERTNNKMKMPLTINTNMEENEKIVVSNNNLVEKDMEIKMLKEELVRVKIQADQEASMMLNMQSMVLLKEEMYMAEDFIKSLMKNELHNYMEVITTNKAITPFIKVKEPQIGSKFNKGDVDLSEVNRLCKCHQCLYENVAMSAYKKDMLKNSTSGKEFLLTKNIFLKIHFNNKEFIFTNDNKDKNKKTILLHNQRSDKMNIRFDIYSKREDDKLYDNNNYNFSRNLNMTLKVVSMDRFCKVSFSAIMVIRAMRSLHSSNMAPSVKMDGIKEATYGDCFKTMVETIFNNKLDQRKMTSIADLTEEEEVAFLSTTEDFTVNIFLNNGDPNSSLNHISFEKFEGSSEIKMYLLVTPMFRDVNFYADKVKNMDSMSISSCESFEQIYKKNEEDLQVEVEKMQKGGTNSIVKFLERGSTSKTNDSSTGVINDLNTKDFKMSKSDSFKEEEFKFVKEDKFEHRMDAFMENRIKRKSTAWVLDDTIWDQLNKSELCNMYFNNSSNDPSLLYLSAMTMREFKAVMFFSENFTTFTRMVINDKLLIMKQALTILPKMFYEKRMEMDGYDMSEQQLDWEYQKFLLEMDDFTSFSTRAVEKLYRFFKLRITMSFYLESVMKDDSDSLNSEWNSIKWNEEKNRMLDENNPQMRMMDNYVNLRSKVYKEESRSIWKFQPKTSTIQFFNNNSYSMKKFIDLPKFYNEDMKSEMTEIKEVLEKL